MIQTRQDARVWRLARLTLRLVSVRKVMMANVIFTLVTSPVFVVHVLWAVRCSEGCSLTLDITCENGTATLETPKNITDALKELQLKDCEGGLWNKSGVLISDAPPFGNARRSELIKQVTHWNLTIGNCPSEINWKISCHEPRYEFLTCYRIAEESKPQQILHPNNEASNRRDRLLLLVPLAVFVSVVVVIGVTLAKG